ncbi:MAG: bifunctional acetate--CoA ligase family protein/GNAT family N-acetyltransferase, partial [Verrucomicrobia bacterium]|nr:bifunctional acetate--CoA ligase family protein/GNAT family N-acetyltransferase [Verrucomicrobiota bacterium]
RATVFGSKAYGKIGDVPSPVDLAVITTRAATAPNLVSECAAAGVKGAVILSAGFRESGVEGIRLEQEIMTRRGEMRIIGPNSLGIMIPDLNLNATFARKLALKGNVAFISQSGGLCTSVLDWSIRQKVGFSLFLSTGSMLDVGWRDLIDYLAYDFHTSSILIYMESLGDARLFLSAAREMALRKPIIVIKAGRTEAAARAVVSHTGALTGDDTVIDSAFRRVGVLRVKTIEDLFSMAEVFSKQPRPKGPRLAIVTNAGGPGVLATDVLVAEGGEVAQLSSESVKELDAILPDGWSRQNPVNLLRDADANRYTNAFEVLTGDSNVDSVLAIVTPQVTTDPTAIAKALATFKNVSEKPILACWMGAADVAEGEAILNASGIPTFQFPDAAARTFCYMWRYSDNLRALYETPGLSGNWSDDLGRSNAKKIIGEVRKSKRTLLTEVESKEVLAAYGIPVVETLVACSEDQAVQAAKELGTTVVLKLYSETITHKTDAGGVRLNLQSETDVRLAYRQIQQAVRDKSGAFLGVTVEPMVKAGYELMFGSSVDPQFGPVLLFGAGGQLVEFLRDYVLGFPPLNATLARRLMERTRIYKALQRTNVDLAQLESILVEFSLLVAEQRWIKEIDVNPLLVSDGGVVALDARIILHESATAEEDLPRLAIRPYPQQYVSSWNSKDGTPLTLRPIRPEDEPLMVKFHSQLSEETVYFRYFGLPRLHQRVAHERLRRICFNDYDREIALVAIRRDPTTKEDEIIGVGRLTKLRGLNQAEFAIVIADQFQRLGLGTKFLSRLVEIGRHEGIEIIFGNILPENYPMQDVAKKCGFQVDYDRFNYAMRAELRLGT